MELIPIALRGRHLIQETYIYIWNSTYKYKLYSKNQKNIHPTNIVKKYSQQAVSKGNEPEYSERFIIQATHELLDMEVSIYLLVDSSTSGPSLYQDFVRKNRLLVKKKKMPK